MNGDNMLESLRRFAVEKSITGLNLAYRHLVLKMGDYLHQLDYLRFRDYLFVKRASDLFIATYPKSGTTWMQFIAWQLLSGESAMTFPHLNSVSPWFESTDLARYDGEYEALTSPRIFKTHYPLQRLPTGVRYVYLARGIKDVAVSYYHHAVNFNRYRGGMDDFVTEFLAGRILGGRWIDHVKAAVSYKSSRPVMFTTYEDLSRRPTTVVEELASFLGVSVSNDRLTEVVRSASFSRMKEQEERLAPAELAPHADAPKKQTRPPNGPPEEEAHDDTRFIRRGVAGGWKATLTTEQAERLDEAVEPIAEYVRTRCPKLESIFH